LARGARIQFSWCRSKRGAFQKSSSSGAIHPARFATDGRVPLNHDLNVAQTQRPTPSSSAAGSHANTSACPASRALIPPRRRRDPSMEYHDPLNAGLVPPLQRPRDGRSTLPVLPSLPELSLLRRCEPYPCMQPHRTPPHPARLEDVASIS